MDKISQNKEKTKDYRKPIDRMKIKYMGTMCKENLFFFDGDTAR
ncbi:MULTISPECIES: hypothetical protein [Prevotella]|nr:hypothetical protein [Prevotella brunnea]